MIEVVLLLIALIALAALWTATGTSAELLVLRREVQKVRKLAEQAERCAHNHHHRIEDVVASAMRRQR